MYLTPIIDLIAGDMVESNGPTEVTEDLWGDSEISRGNFF